jgi:hypothetical protein
MSLPEIVMVPLNKIRPNPWRDFKRNPIDADKVEQLTESIKTTGEFWIGVYGRKVTGGFIELAFGHNRLEAAKAVDTGDAIEAAKAAGLKAIPVALREFTDGEMLMRMTRENLRGELPVVLEAVSAAVQALAEGKIEVPAPDPKTRKDAIRYAPSFMPGKVSEPSEGSHAYTADTLARVLGGVYVKAGRESTGRAQNSVVAALGILELEEKGIDGFTSCVYADKSIREIIPMVTDIKQRHIIQVERQGKTAAELEALRAKQLEAQARAKDDEKKSEEDHRALVKMLADAQREENNRKADALAKQIKENDTRAKEKEALNKVRMKELDKQLAAKKAWEAQQVVQDVYLPIRRDVETLITRWETKVSERDAEREQVKALAKLRALRPEDRMRLRKAAAAVAGHYDAWVAAQFAPLPTEKAELKEMKKREVAKSNKENK